VKEISIAVSSGCGEEQHSSSPELLQLLRRDLRGESPAPNLGPLLTLLFVMTTSFGDGSMNGSNDLFLIALKPSCGISLIIDDYFCNWVFSSQSTLLRRACIDWLIEKGSSTSIRL
jgi:hypothetical protein